MVVNIYRLLAVMVLMTFISGCGSVIIEPEEDHIGLILSTLDNPFFKEIEKSASIEAGKRGLRLSVMTSNNSFETELEVMSELLDQGVSLVILNPTDALLSKESLDLAKDRGVPVITLDRAIEEGTVLSHITSDNVAGGRMAASFLRTILEEEAKVLLLEGIQGTSANTERVAGFESYRSDEGFEEASRMTADFSRDKAYQLVMDLLQEDIEYEGLFAVNDEMALGVMDALLEVGEQMVIIDFDGTEAAVEAVVQGYLAGTVAQRPDEMGRLAIETAHSFKEGKKIESLILVDLELITTRN